MFAISVCVDLSTPDLSQFSDTGRVRVVGSDRVKCPCRTGSKKSTPRSSSPRRLGVGEVGEGGRGGGWGGSWPGYLSPVPLQVFMAL